MLNSFIYMYLRNYAGIIGWSLNKMLFKLPIYHISIFDASVKLIATGWQQSEQVGSPVYQMGIVLKMTVWQEQEYEIY